MPFAGLSSRIRQRTASENIFNYGDAAVGHVGRAGLGELAVQRVDVLEAHVGDFPMGAEMRPDVQVEHLPVGAARGWPLAHDVLGKEALDQLGHGRGGALVLDVAERIAASIDLACALAPLARAPSVVQSPNRLWCSAARAPPV